MLDRNSNSRPVVGEAYLIKNYKGQIMTAICGTRMQNLEGDRPFVVRLEHTAIDYSHQYREMGDEIGFHTAFLRHVGDNKFEIDDCFGSQFIPIVFCDYWQKLEFPQS